MGNLLMVQLQRELHQWQLTLELVLLFIVKQLHMLIVVLLHVMQ